MYAAGEARLLRQTRALELEGAKATVDWISWTMENLGPVKIIIFNHEETGAIELAKGYQLFSMVPFS